MHANDDRYTVLMDEKEQNGSGMDMMANITKEEIVVEQGMRVVNYNERAWIKQTKARSLGIGYFELFGG